MDLIAGDWQVFQQEKPGDPCIAPGVFGGHAVFVTPKYVRLAPGYLIPERRLSQEFIGPP